MLRPEPRNMFIFVTFFFSIRMGNLVPDLEKISQFDPRTFQTKNKFDQHDVAATVLGGISVSFVIKIDLINFGSEAKKKRKKRKNKKHEK